MFRPLTLAAPLALLIAGCTDDGDGNVVSPTPTPSGTASPTPSPSATPTPTPSASTVRVGISFATANDGFLADYADYSQGQEETIGFFASVRALPASLPGRTGFLLSSTNRSDDVFMFLTKPVTTLIPNRRYRVDTSITFATNAPAGCVGIGGAPGEAVRVKAGASPVQPAKILSGNDVRVNFDKGNQATSGAEVKVIGDFTQPQSGGSCSNGPYQLKTLTSGTAGPIVTADANGRLWIVIGTDSGFEGLTRIYYLDGSVTFTPV